MEYQRIILVLLSLLLAPAPQIQAAEVKAALSTRRSYVGIPFYLQLDVSDAAEIAPPDAIDVDGLVITATGLTNQSSQISIINGVRTESKSVTYAYRIVAQREGDFEIPPLEIVVDGMPITTKALRFTIAKSETGDLLDVALEIEAPYAYVGQALPLKLKIAVKPYADAQYNITLQAEDMWQLISSDLSSFGPFESVIAQLGAARSMPKAREELRTSGDGVRRTYYVYTLETVLYPVRPGKLDVERMRVVFSYPTELGRESRLLFQSTLRIAESRPIAADVPAPDFAVKPIPNVGLPADYQGAVGNYYIKSEVSPLAVRAGDPITLRMEIGGTGRMESVSAPPLTQLTEISKDFVVPDESLAGIVEDDIKHFTTTLRPRHVGITEIPPIPFSFFDPQDEEFKTVYSSAIPIEVRTAERLDLATIENSANPSAGSEVPTESGATQAGDQLSFQIVGDSAALRAERESVGWIFWLAICAPPLLFALVLSRRKIGSLVAAAGRLRPWVRHRTRRAITEADSVRQLVDATSGYLSQKLGTTDITLQCERLREKRDLRFAQAWEHFHRQCEHALYAGREADLHRLKANALDLVNQLDAGRWEA